MCDEFREQADILSHRPQTHRALHTEHQSRPRKQHLDSDDEQTSEDDSGEDRPAQLLAMFTKMLSSRKPNTKPGSNKEVCRKYLAGKCTWGSKRFRQHPEGKEGSKKEDVSRKEGIRCYNCQEVGSHIAHDCKQPKVQRANQAQDETKNLSLSHRG